MTGNEREYAVALFTLSEEKNISDSVLDGLHLLRDTFQTVPDYEAFLSSPAIPKNTRLQAIRDAFDASAPEYAVSLLSLLCESGKVGLFHGCVTEYEKLYESSRARGRVIVTSALPLTGKECSALIAKLEKRSGRHLTACYRVDPAIIGGLIVEIDGQIIDGSVKHRLENIKEVIDE